MPELYYKEALKLGQKKYRACVSSGISPCLPVMDDFIPSERSGSGTDLGIVQIPAEYIVGTKTRGRTDAFALNFMPLLPESTEFATKWQALCSAHLEEGIREPILAYEYMNRFYVEEGNKRVSVLKFFNAAEIPGKVTRVLPERSGEKEVEIYYEFLDFYKCSHINFIEFSKIGSFSALLQAVGKGKDETWTEEERRRFTTSCHYFRQAYQASGGGKLQSTVWDAMLSYIQVYGYPELCNAAVPEIKKSLVKIWEEVKLQQEQPPVELKLTPGEEKKPGFLSKVLPGSNPSALKAAFLYDKTPEISGWTAGHELGRRYAQRVFSDQIETSAWPNAMEVDPSQTLEDAIAAGNRLIFTTSPILLQASLHAAIEHPETVIMNCSLNAPHRYIRSYYARMYEVKFIIGAIAASLSDHGDLGYICDYPIFGQIAGINAFALGAQMVNPKARVFLEWSSIKGGDQASKRLSDRGIRLISSQDTAKFTAGNHSSFGLSYISDDKPLLLAAPIWKWGVYYEQILRRMLNKTVKAEYENSRRAVNYYWGISAGVVGLSLSSKLPEGTRRLVDFLKESISHDLCSPFRAPLYGQGGGSIGEGQSELTQEQIISMDYLVENVIGSIPRYDDLSAIGKATVDAVGIRQSSKQSGSSAEGEN